MLVCSRLLFALSQECGNHADGVHVLFFGHFHNEFKVLSGDNFELVLEVKLTKVIESDEDKTVSRLFETLEQNLILGWKQKILTF